MTSRTFFLQFPAGLDRLVENALTRDFDRLTVVERDDSSVFVKTTSTVEEIESLSYVNNRFLVLGRADAPEIADAIPAFQHLIRTKPRLLGLGPKDEFRIMSSSGGQLTSIPSRGRAALERAITQRTKAGVARRGSSVEFWLLQRRNSTRITFARKLARTTTPAAKGALSSALSALLVRAVPSSSEDVFLDPFGGSGSIALARAELPARSIVSSDLTGIEGAAASRLRRAGVTVRRDDALTLLSVDDESVDTIVTDPPWGEWDRDGWNDEDYATFARTARRVLRPGGSIAILIARRRADSLDRLLSGSRFRVSERFELLVNGHPASLLCATAM